MTSGSMNAPCAPREMMLLPRQPEVLWRHSGAIEQLASASGQRCTSVDGCCCDSTQARACDRGESIIRSCRADRAIRRGQTIANGAVEVAHAAHAVVRAARIRTKGDGMTNAGLRAVASQPRGCAAPAGQ